MEVCPEAELIAVEDPATVCDRAFQIGEGRKVAVRERLIQNGPQVLGGLKLGGVRGQVGKPDPIWHDQVRLGVPAGAVEPEHDHALASRPGLRANSASSAAKNGLDTPFDTDQKVSPEIGCTKAVTYNHLYRWWPSAIGRWPLGAHARRRIGFSPMRCSSVAQTSTGLSGCLAASSVTTAASFF